MFTVIPLVGRHKSAVLGLLYKSFLTESPIAIALGITKEEATPRYEGLVEQALNDGFSFVAVDKAGGVVGCDLCTLWKRQNPRRILSDSNYRPVEEFIIKVEDDFANAFPNVDSALHSAYVFVHHKFRRMGILQQVTQKTIEAAKNNGISVIFAFNITHKTQDLCEALGFKTVSTYEYANTPFKNGLSNEKCCKLQALKLTNDS